jgi:cyclopropane fatty-acyl-phospholipid synthase-like methyltransferase
MSSLAPFVSSPPEVVRRMLEIVEAKQGETLYDIGSGDGRILITAVQQFDVSQAVGVEMRSDLVKKAREAVEKIRLTDRIKIFHKNVFEVDVSTADIITLYLTTTGNNKLKPKLEKELKPESRVVSHDFSFPDWKSARVESFGGHTIYLYRMSEVTP